MIIYNYSPIDNSYTNSCKADKSPLEDDVYLIPAFATKKQIPEYTEYQIPVFENKKWVLKDDYTKTTIYSKDNGSVITAKIGENLEDLNATLIPKPSEYYVWSTDDSNWILDISLETQDKIKNITIMINSLLSMANLKIEIYNDACQLGIATGLEKDLLNAWKEYRVILNRIPQQDTYPDSVVYPDLPE